MDETTSESETLLKTKKMCHLSKKENKTVSYNWVVCNIVISTPYNSIQISIFEAKFEIGKKIHFETFLQCRCFFLLTWNKIFDCCLVNRFFGRGKLKSLRLTWKRRERER